MEGNGTIMEIVAIATEEIDRGIDGRLVYFKYPLDVYNPSVPFADGGETVIAGRAEKRSGNISQTVFFKEKSGVYSPISGAPTFPLEDPFVSRVQGRLVFGGVEVDRETGVYKTLFYVGTSIYDLKFLMAGPPGMKDVRLVELADGTVGVFTRPQGNLGGRGKIGFTKVATLREIDERTLSDAPLIGDQFGPMQWGGVNQAILLSDGTIGVIGHRAYFGQNKEKHYAAMSFEFDPRSSQSAEMKIIARREDFPPTEAKRWDLGDVVFPAGLVREKSGRAQLYAGLSDVAVGCLEINWPFS